jgi:flagellin-like protein
MHRRRLDSRGLSEIVGTLMLVLIVVAAATAFSFFVASYEKTLLAQEATNHTRSLEALDVVAVHTMPVMAGSAIFGNLTITMASEDVNTIQITNLLVNGNVVVSYQLTYLSNGTEVNIGIKTGEGNSSFLLPTLQQVDITLQLNTSATLFSFLASSEIPTAQSYLIIEFETQLGNDFKSIYVPPTALAELTYIQSVNHTGVIVENPVLDGTHSFQQGGNETIVGWNWLITNTTSHGTWTGTGAQLELNLTASDAAFAYAANLTVFNSIGLFAVSPTISIAG